jgi:hypothetical protein
VYANGITITAERFTLAWAPVAAPGFTWSAASPTHYELQSVAVKEVQFS